MSRSAQDRLRALRGAAVPMGVMATVAMIAAQLTGASAIGVSLTGASAIGAAPTDVASRSAAPTATADAAWRRAAPGYAWSFPGDHWAHPEYKTEWWYFTGHLATAETAEPRYGFQFTFFRVGLMRGEPPSANAWSATDLIMGHASLTDVATGDHIFSEVLYRASPLLGGFGAYPDSLVAWSRAPGGTTGRWTLTWTGEGFRIQARDARQGLDLDVTATPRKPLVFQGPDGYSRKSAGDKTAGDKTVGAEGAASLYYSFTRMEVTGAVGGRGDPRRVTGQCWMDREIFTNTLAPGQVGWDWLSLQLADGRDLMVYRLRNAAGEVDYGLGTLVGADGSVRWLELDDWSWTAGATWRSPETGAEYPVKWGLRVPTAGIDVTLTARVAAQENVSRRSGVRYWEGAVVAEAAASRDGPKPTDRPVGYGYVELTGYGEGNRPPI